MNYLKKRWVTLRLLSLTAVLLAFVGIGILIGKVQAGEALQVLISATPVPIDLPSPLPFFTNIPVATEAPTRTPTPIGPALLEALTEANVRAQPDTASDKLGVIQSGNVYPIVGRYYQWFQFQYSQSVSGVGWVFGDLVRVIGDQSTIPDLTQGDLPTLDPLLAGATQTLAIATQTPGGILTLTANSGSISLPVQLTPGGAQVPAALPANPGVLPTFTFPANISLPTLAVTESEALTATAPPIVEGLNVSLPPSVPPIVPIIILGGLGLLGLFVSSYRR